MVELTDAPGLTAAGADALKEYEADTATVAELLRPER
jgi:hypothetical protein